MTPYEVLGLPNNAGEAAAKAARTKLLFKWHPDRCKDVRATQKSKEINEAFTAIKNGYVYNPYEDQLKQQWDRYHAENERRRQEAAHRAERLNREYAARMAAYQAFQRAEQARKERQKKALGINVIIWVACIFFGNVIGLSFNLPVFATIVALAVIVYAIEFIYQVHKSYRLNNPKRKK